MIYSMTGFGRSTVQMGNVAYTIELRSLNSKQFDLNLRIPNYLREKEMDIRNILSEKLMRGKIEMYITTAKGTEPVATTFNLELIDSYMQQLGKLNKNYQLNDTNLLQTLMQMPNVLVTEETTLSEEEWQLFQSAITDAIKKLITFRTQEGQALEKDLKERIDAIADNGEKVAETSPNRIEKVKERIKQNLEQLQLKADYDKDRFEQEMIYYIEKFDITEELVRLRNHCHYFIENLHSEEAMKGKKLNFISQELGREINTIGSKANDVAIQKLVVSMKDDLEKIKEQMNNVL